MLDSLLSGLSDQIPGDLLEKVGLDSSKANDVAKVAGDSAMQVMGKELMSGGIGNLMNLFSNKPNSNAANALQNNLMETMVGNFISKLGLNKKTSNLLAQTLVPILVNMVTKKNNETPEDDSSPITDLFGGKSGGIADAAKSILGGLFK